MKVINTVDNKKIVNISNLINIKCLCGCSDGNLINNKIICISCGKKQQ
jgi:hypothetical protein